MGSMKNQFGILRTFLVILLFVQGGTLFGLDGSERSENENQTADPPPVFSRTVLIPSANESAVSERPAPPSKAKAFFLSFLLPGAGEYYAGSKKMAKFFLGTEVLLWSAYVSFRMYGNWKKSDYELFAVSHAGIQPAGKNYDYYVAMENYNSLREYNEAKLRQRNLADLYPEDEQHDWQWDSKDSRRKFGTLRVASDRAYNRSLFVIGGIFINHLISGIDALRLARKEEKKYNRDLRVGVAGLPEGGMVLSLWKVF
jgi:hypothetical protein